jgi:hypothetical protein
VGISSDSKIKSLVHALPQHGVVTRSALAALGITPQHTQKYVAGGWLESVGSGVFKRAGDTPTWVMAERAALPLFARLDHGRIDLGRGARSLAPKGAYVAKYELVVPRALVRE